MSLIGRLAVWGSVVTPGYALTVLASNYLKNDVAQHVLNNSQQIINAWGKNGMRIANNLDDVVRASVSALGVLAIAITGALVDHYLVPYIDEYEERRATKKKAEEQ